jgi:hypothetical protein
LDSSDCPIQRIRWHSNPELKAFERDFGRIYIAERISRRRNVWAEGKAVCGKGYVSLDNVKIPVLVFSGYNAAFQNRKGIEDSIKSGPKICGNDCC